MTTDTVTAGTRPDLITRLRSGVAARTPESWRAPVFITLAERPWLFIVACLVAVTAVVIAMAIRAPKYALITFWYSSVIFALAFTREIVGGDRTPSRWVLLFQCPGSATRHYARTGLVAFGLTLLCMLLPSAALAIVGLGTGSSPYFISGAIQGGLAWATVVFCVSFGISGLVRQHNVELTILLIFVSATQGLLTRSVGLSASGSRVVEYLLFPINALGEVWYGISGDMNLDTPHALHLVIYPLAWLVIGFLSIRRLEGRDLADVAGE